MSTKNNKSAATGVRYTDAKKKEVVDFVVQYNSKNGRGGQNSAFKKFNVSPITIVAWMKAAGVPTATKGAVKTTTQPATEVKESSKVGRGSRYTPEKKQEIIDFVTAYNAEHGRGGQSKAIEKYKVSAITCATWLKAVDVPAAKAPKAPKAPKETKAPKAPKETKAPKAPKETKAPKAPEAPKAAKDEKSAIAPAGLATKVASLIDLNDQIRKSEGDLEKLYAKHDSMMASIKGWI